MRSPSAFTFIAPVRWTLLVTLLLGAGAGGTTASLAYRADAHSAAPGTRAFVSGAGPGRPAEFDARALELLEQMADAYTQLPALEQTTEFYASMKPLKPAPETEGKPAADKDDKLPQTLLLRYAEPNRLLLERREVDPQSEKPTITRWLSDGKTFWTYNQAKNAYTKEKSPGRLRDFARLPSLNSGSLELLMLMGINPFGKLKEQVDSVQYEGTTLVRGDSTEIVLMRIATAEEATEARFYIGKADHLLRRLVVETAPITAPSGPGKVGDGLDELVDAQHPASANPAAPAPMKTRFLYENILRTQPHFDSTTFLSHIPEGALLHESFDPTGKRTKQLQEEQIANILKSKGYVLPRKLRVIRP